MNTSIKQHLILPRVCDLKWFLRKRKEKSAVPTIVKVRLNECLPMNESAKLRSPFIWAKF
jgi:hypothetical protein